MKMIMLTMLMVCVSAGPLPPLKSSFSQDEQNKEEPYIVSRDTENVSIRFDPAMNSSQFATLRNNSSDMNFTLDTASRSVARWNPYCMLPTCGVDKLGSDLQHGDEKAGDSTRDPLGPGKK